MKSGSKFLIPIVILTLLGLALLGYFSDKEQATENKSMGSGSRKNTEVKIYTIELGENGFSPEKLLIQNGDVVKFSSTRGGWFWPASNPHPAHSTYSTFDPKKPLTAEEIWEFKFQQNGEWKYHDHLAPYFTGTIIVENYRLNL